MKRYASHYLFLPGIGFLKQQVVEVAGDGISVAYFPLTEEMESVEWVPGVIALLSAVEMEILSLPEGEEVLFAPSWQKGANAIRPDSVVRYPVLFYPFDFTAMQPDGETRHRLLR